MVKIFDAKNFDKNRHGFVFDSTHLNFSVRCAKIIVVCRSRTILTREEAQNMIPILVVDPHTFPKLKPIRSTSPNSFLKSFKRTEFPVGLHGDLSVLLLF